MKEEKGMKAGARRKKQYFTLLAFIGFGGGTVFIAAGFILLILHSLIKESSLLDETGTALLIFSYPLLFLGGHFMDKAGENK